MPQETQESKEIIIKSNLTSPHRALEIGETLIGVRGHLLYRLELIEEGKWKVIVTRGEIVDLLNVINSTQSVDVVQNSEKDDREIECDLTNYLPDAPTKSGK